MDFQYGSALELKPVSTVILTQQSHRWIYIQQNENCARKQTFPCLSQHSQEPKQRVSMPYLNTIVSSSLIV